jgi:dolichol-phosphate hexosyltransferase
MHAINGRQSGSYSQMRPRMRERHREDREEAGGRLQVGKASRRLSRLREDIKLSIIMAAFNEEDTIEQAIDEVLAVDYPCEMELIIVDDGSRDRTPELLAQLADPRVVVLTHLGNRGKGAALLTGITTATGSYILPFDADLEYLPDDILRLLEPVLMGRCSVVYGVRLFGYNTVYRSYIYALGNRILTRTTNIMFGACLSDLHTCLKLIPTSILRSLVLTERGFGLDTEISASLLRHGVRPFEVPVSYFSRSHEEGKKITWRDALGCLWILIRVRLQPRRRLSFANGAESAENRLESRAS